MYVEFISLIFLDNSVPVAVRVYCSAQDSILCDNTIVFVIGALNAPPGITAFIDANQCFIPFAGDSLDDDYKKMVLNMPYLHVFAIGKVLSQADLANDGMARCFDIAVSEWVLDGMKQFTLKRRIKITYFNVNCFTPSCTHSLTAMSNDRAVPSSTRSA